METILFEYKKGKYIFNVYSTASFFKLITSFAKHKKILFSTISPMFNSKLLFKVVKDFRDALSKNVS